MTAPPSLCLNLHLQLSAATFCLIISVTALALREAACHTIFTWRTMTVISSCTESKQCRWKGRVSWAGRRWLASGHASLSTCQLQTIATSRYFHTPSPNIIALAFISPNSKILYATKFSTSFRKSLDRYELVSLTSDLVRHPHHVLLH